MANSHKKYWTCCNLQTLLKYSFKIFISYVMEQARILRSCLLSCIFIQLQCSFLWIIVGTRFVGFLAHNHNEMKWNGYWIFFSTDLYPSDFLRDIYETFLVFEQHDVWWYRRCIEKQINATSEIHPIVVHLLHFDCKVSFNYLVSDWSPITCSWHQKTNSPIHECEVMHKSKRPFK